MELSKAPEGSLSDQKKKLEELCKEVENDIVIFKTKQSFKRKSTVDLNQQTSKLKAELKKVRRETQKINDEN